MNVGLFSAITVGLAIVSSPLVLAGLSPESIAMSDRANVLLVKRVTAISSLRLTSIFSGDVAIASDPNNSHANPYWPPNYLQGGGVPEDTSSPIRVKPGDEVEYTIYFLNAGKNGAKNLRICDVLAPHQTYLPGVRMTIGTDKISNTDTQVQYIPAGGVIPANCGIDTGINTNGIVVVDVTDDRFPILPGAIAKSNKSYGSISFRTRIN